MCCQKTFFMHLGISVYSNTIFKKIFAKFRIPPHPFLPLALRSPLSFDDFSPPSRAHFNPSPINFAEKYELKRK